MENISVQGTITTSFEKSIELVENGLKKQGFGVVSRIDMHATLKEKLDVEIKKYTILGACNAPYAYQVLLSDPLAGLLLPCNVTVEELSERETRISFIRPSIMLSIGEIGKNEKISAIAADIEKKLSLVASDIFA